MDLPRIPPSFGLFFQVRPFPTNPKLQHARQVLKCLQMCRTTSIPPSQSRGFTYFNLFSWLIMRCFIHALFPCKVTLLLLLLSNCGFVYRTLALSTTHPPRNPCNGMSIRVETDWIETVFVVEEIKTRCSADGNEHSE